MIAPPAWFERLPRAERFSARIPGARGMGAAELEAAVEALYRDLFARAAAAGRPHPLRLWNFIPGILEHVAPPKAEAEAWDRDCPRHERFDRYMAFNAGRARFMLPWAGGAAALAARVPCASGVGHGGTALTVHGWFGAAPGAPVENPRQTPAFRYSPRFGPLPPCFARATRCRMAGADAGRDALLVAGTASVVGEDTLHAGLLAEQVAETRRNLEALLATQGFALDTLREARLYVAARADDAEAMALTRAALPGVEVELCPAVICRPGLMIEIEGLALA